MSEIRVLLADDQELVRMGFRMVLEAEPDIRVVGEAADGASAIGLAMEHRPDVVLMDVRMPGLDGIAATEQVKKASPGTRVLIVTTFGRPGYLRRALRAGASGFVVKDTPARELADAVRRIQQGLRVVDPVLAADSLVAGDSPLTARETEVLQAARDGSSVAVLAGRLHLSEGTIRNHLSAAIGKTDLEISMIIGRSRATVRFHIHNASIKLDAVNRSQTVFKAAQLGYISLQR